MSTMTHIRRAPHDEFASVVQDETRSRRDSAAGSARSEIGPSLLAIAAGVLVIAGLIALRLWFLMPGAFNFAN
jgi:hypothetical protein